MNTIVKLNLVSIIQSNLKIFKLQRNLTAEFKKFLENQT